MDIQGVERLTINETQQTEDENDDVTVNSDRELSADDLDSLKNYQFKDVSAEEGSDRGLTEDSDGSGNFDTIISVIQDKKIDISKCAAKLDQKEVFYTGNEIKPELVVSYGDKVLKNGEDYKVSWKNNIKPGTATVIIQGIGKNYGELTVDFKIVEGSHSWSSWKVVASPQVGKKGLKERTCSICNATEKAEIPALQAATNGTTSGTSTKVVKLKSTKITSLKRGKRNFTVKWKKISSGLTGYQIQYSKNKNFKKSKTIQIKSAKTVKKKVSGIKKGSYYVRVRTVRKTKGKTYYSSWSGKKKVKVK